MSLQRAAAITLRHFYLIRGSIARLVPMFAWVAIDMILWGFLTRYLNTVSSPGFNFVPVLLGAVLLWDFFVRVMHGVTTAFLEDVWSRNFLNIFAAPISISEYVTGLVFSSIVTSLFGLAVMLALATTVFGLSFFQYGILLVPYLLVLFLFGIALGTAACAMVLGLGPAAEWFTWPIPALISPFAAVFYPLSVLPKWMQYLGHALPPSYVFEGMRAVIERRPAPATQLGWAGGLCVLDIALAGWLFSRVYRHALRTGLIARYSAESVS